MKKLAIGLFVILAAACQQQKIGYVNTVELLDGYQEKIDVETRFNTKRSAFTKKRDSISQAFQLELQDFQTKAQKMSQKNAQEEYNLLQQRGQFVGQQLQQEEQQLQQTSQTEIDSIVSKVKNEIKAFGKANGYAYILSGGDGGAVLYGNDADDLTDKVLKILNDKYKK
ncbi:OmpH family outer membrane protein [Allomuricauda sp. SCSIO 65647]|uniref:OmpH family outer membrane protein n=1 Tax=Allomuricauda sp. SCSIO 65647 TaxID=2908843 RepID=UPI001F17FB7F|nr:OmpH family outer membrane protein [Muricauda sp. SCSIO 65647]UJH69059.1 OmpH family outer membrane protein [Muricauda sp. SCSIO 65647]